jgi:hypothetical protein
MFCTEITFLKIMKGRRVNVQRLITKKKRIYIYIYSVSLSLPKTSRPTLEPTHPPANDVLSCLSGGRAAGT